LLRAQNSWLQGEPLRSWLRRLLPSEKAGDARARVGRGARSFISAYQPELLLIVNQAHHEQARVGSTLVRFERVWDVDSVLDELGFAAA